MEYLICSSGLVGIIIKSEAGIKLYGAGYNLQKKEIGVYPLQGNELFVGGGQWVDSFEDENGWPIVFID